MAYRVANGCYWRDQVLSDDRSGGPSQGAGSGVLSVREVTTHVKRLLDRDELLSDVLVRGEISNFTRAASGHLYFSLKDDQSQLSAVLFRGAAQGLRFSPKDGDLVVAGGSVTVYERGGRYQLIARFMRPDGAGDLAAALELLKARLEAEGLFDPTRKRPLPRYPRTIAVCTSPTGAAVRDLCSIIGRRYPPAKVIVVPTVVQGDEAPGSIVRALQIAAGLPEVDVIIVGRGGGSMEDLWAFNDEMVARAIYASGKPVVSAVGHETDFTIADFVADVRAATPSMAAELVTPDIQELVAGLESLGGRLRSGLGGQWQRAKARLDRALAHPIFRRPRSLLQERQIRADDAAAGMLRNAQRILERRQARLQKASATLDALSPHAVVGRGYAICRREDGSLVRRVGDVDAGDSMTVTVSDGDLIGTVTERCAREGAR